MALVRLPIACQPGEYPINGLRARRIGDALPTHINIEADSVDGFPLMTMGSDRPLVLAYAILHKNGAARWREAQVRGYHARRSK